MDIRTAGAAEMLALWGENPDHPSPTARFNCENIGNHNATFYVWDRAGQIVGELYLFRSLSDPDFADGKKRGDGASARPSWSMPPPRPVGRALPS